MSAFLSDAVKYEMFDNDDDGLRLTLMHVRRRRGGMR